MIITPYRVLFEVDEDSDTGRYRFSKPTSEMEKVDLSSDGQAYVVTTHDRGDHEGPGPYYQIAFRIEDPSPYSYDDLELRLDSAIFRNKNGEINNDLVCNVDKRKTPDNLWYQQSRYEYDKRTGRWRIVSDSKKKALVVDCITTSGVFRPVVLHKGKILSNISFPWVYVLPSSVSLQNYQDMLSDLINLHDSLIRNNSSTVGVGTITAIESDTIRIRRELELTNELESTIRSIIAMPSELQGKQYLRMPIRKIHHYDSRVIREFIRHGSAGKALGVSYFENHDTYENRIIKHILKRIQSMYLLQKRRGITIPDNLEIAVQNEYLKRTAIKKATKKSFHGVDKTFSFRYRPPIEGKVPLSISVNGNCVNMPRHAPFSSSGRHYIKMSLKAQSKAELMFYLSALDQTISLQTQNEFTISCTVLETRKTNTSGGNTIYELVIGDISSINGITFIKDTVDLTDYQYESDLRALCERNAYINCTGNFRFFIVPEKEISVGIAREEELHMKAEIRSDLVRQRENALAFDSLLEATSRLTNLLNDSWFSNISDLQELTNVRPSAKFQMNKYYKKAYQLITEMMADHSILSSDFDINAFGVIKTELVFEYWVFYRLLYQLQSIGFRLDNQETLTDHYRSFIQGNVTGTRPSGYVVIAKRKLNSAEICIEIGYERTFQGLDDQGNVLQRTPDYYLCVKTNSGNHWYFIDAKYKCFSRDQKYKVNYLQEIYDVSLSKYIADMGQIFDTSNAQLGSAKDIRGSYIVMADVDDLPSELSETNRLFGGDESILDSKSIKQWDKRVDPQLIDISSEHLPCHRYGAIHLTPEHIDELQSLLELIFEYLETDKDDDHSNLHFCWKCGNSNPAIRETKETSTSTNETKYYKYYVTCPHCSAFRSDNHCRSCGKAIIKHTKGNFHKRDESVTSPQWAFICPDCGSPVNGFTEIDENELEEISNPNSTRAEHYSMSWTYQEPPPLTDEELARMAPFD